MAMEAPHHSFWMEASSDMPDVLKKRCVEAFEKIHARGVYHGNVRLENMVIGGDAKITILNFHGSRCLFANSAGLQSADPVDLQTEMRLVKFLLDYEDARLKEYADKNIPESIYLRLPLPIVPPKRFVMPGQTNAELYTEIQQFADIVNALEAETQPGSFSRRSLSPPPDDQSDTDPDISLSGGPRYYLRSRKTSPSPVPDSQPPSLPRVHKRKSADDTGSASENRPVKKLRFSLGSHEPLGDFSRVSGMSKLCSWKTLSQCFIYPDDGSVLRSSVYQESQDLPVNDPQDFVGATSVRERIVDENIQRCIMLGLPHPDALKQDPDNPHWSNPDVAKYCELHNQNVDQAMQMNQRFPDRPVRVPQPRRSEGGLKRAMAAVARARNKPSTPFEPPRSETSLGKRKAEWGDRSSSSISSTPPATTKRVKREDTDDTAYLSTWGKPGGSGAISKNRSRAVNATKPRRAPILRTGNDHRNRALNPFTPHSSPEPQISPYLPREAGILESLARSSSYLRVRAPTGTSRARRMLQPSRTEEGREKLNMPPVNDLGIRLTLCPPYAGLLTRCLGGFRRLLD